MAPAEQGSSVLQEHLEVVVIGGGQAGLTAGSYLSRRARKFLIIDAASRIGDSWRSRWDSLRLFTPRVVNQLPRLLFPSGLEPFPTKDEMANYLEDYAATFRLPICLNARVTRLTAAPDGFRAETAQGTWRARQVIVATGIFRRPLLPEFSTRLGPNVFQIHSSTYRNPRQIPQGPVLIVGAANSGGEIAEELSLERQVYVATGTLLRPVFPWLRRQPPAWRLATLRAIYAQNSRFPWPLGDGRRLLIPNIRALVRDRGVKLFPRAVGAEGNTVQFSDGSSLRVDNIVWATGYRPDYGWIEIPAFNPHRRPARDHGESVVPGLHFIGESLLPLAVYQARRVVQAVEKVALTANSP